MGHQIVVSHDSLRGAMKSVIAAPATRISLLVVAAISGAACSEYGDLTMSEREAGDFDSGAESGTRDRRTVDAVSAEDAAPLTDASIDGATDNAAIFDARDASAADATSDDPSLTDRAEVGGAIDVADDAADGSSRDATRDPTAPRFARTGRYAIVIPRLGDAGTSVDGGSTADGGDAGADDPADVYYPDPPDLRTGSYAFPIVLLLQGAKVARGFYSGVAAGVAAYGFVVVVPDHTSNNIGGPGLYAESSEIAAVGAEMKIEATRATAPVRGVIDTMRMALMGHSYGGACGLSAISKLCFPPVPLCSFQRPPELVAGAFYGTHLAAPVLGVPTLDNGAVPVLLMQGDRDGKALPADALKTYDQIQQRPKAIISLIGANHYGVADVDNPVGADPDVNTPMLAHAEGVASIARWMGLFLAAFVYEDADARRALRSAGALDPRVAITLAE
jgi:dienelactone hydrolase